MSLTAAARRLVFSVACRQSPLTFFSRHLSANQAQTFNNDSLGKMVKEDKVVVFMKGIPDAPKCGFSNAVVQVLRMHGVPFTAHNVLDSEQLRQAVKDYTTWPTIPQIFIDGEFVGGCDILLEKHQNGELIDDLLKVGIKSQVLADAQNQGDNNNK